MALLKRESVLIETTSNGGFIVVPKEIVGRMDSKKDVLVFESLKNLIDWQKDHFAADEPKQESKTQLRVAK